MVEVKLSRFNIVSLFRTLEPFSRVALAVSGGPDSMALMHLVALWCGESRRDPGDIAVLTVDHRLRRESAAESSLVRDQAQRLGFSHVTLAWQGEKPRAGLQAAAREARYALMTAHCRAQAIPCLATGHTRDDQAETFIMRLKRGSGIDGLAGMAPISERSGVVLLRPLLDVSKARLLSFLRDCHVPFARDPANQNLAFERTRVRHSMTVLSRAGLRREALARSAARIGRAKEAIAYLTEELLAAHLVVFPLGDATLPARILADAPAELALRLFARILLLIGGEAPAPRLTKLESLLEKRRAPRWKATLGGCLIAAFPESIRFYREAGRIGQDACILHPGETAIWDARFIISLAHEAGAPVTVKALGETGWLSVKPEERAAFKGQRLAALTTPAAFCEGKLAMAPLLGLSRPGSSQFRASLVAALARFVTAA